MQDELDDDAPMECACGENGLPVIVVVDNKWMCASCIQNEINSLRDKLLKDKNPKSQEIKEWDIITSKNRESLISEMRYRIKQGWLPTGGLCVFDGRMVQAIAKKGE